MISANIKHAFAINSKTKSVPTKAQKTVVDKVCREIARRHLTTPALIFLESFRPLNFIGSQIMHFFHPFISAVVNADGYQQFSEFLESRNSIDYLYERIEFFEEEYEKQINKDTRGKNE